MKAGKTRAQFGLEIWPGETHGRVKSRMQNLVAGFYSVATLEACAEHLGKTAEQLRKAPRR